MRLFIEHTSDGILVRCGSSENFLLHLGRFKSLPEALAFIRSRMEPEGEGEKEYIRDKIQLVVPPTTATFAPEWSKVKLGDWIKTKAGKVGLVCGGLGSVASPDCFDVEFEGGSSTRVNKAHIDAIVPPPAAPEKPLDKLQRLGQEYDATPTDPPWKRAKVGDHIRTNAGNVFQLVEKECGGVWMIFRQNGETGHINETDIAAILPTPPRHGDFGSRPEEDGA